MQTVTLYHPKLDRSHDFPAAAVEQMKRSGWTERKRRKTSAPLVSEESTEDAADGGSTEE